MKKKRRIQGTVSGLTLEELYRHANERILLEGGSVEEVAELAGTSASRVYAYQAGDAETMARVLEVVVAQARLGCPLVLNRLARRGGYLLVPVPPAEGMDEEALEAVETAVSRAAETVRTFVGAIRDGVVTSEEQQRLDEEVRAAESALESLRVLAEGMAVSERPARRGRR